MVHVRPVLQSLSGFGRFWTSKLCGWFLVPLLRAKQFLELGAAYSSPLSRMQGERNSFARVYMKWRIPRKQTLQKAVIKASLFDDVSQELETFQLTISPNHPTVMSYCTRWHICIHTNMYIYMLYMFTMYLQSM